jgi:Gas vesicle synthesis protein GvpO
VRTTQGTGAGPAGRERVEQRSGPQPEDECDEYDRDEFDDDEFVDDEDEYDEDEYEQALSPGEAAGSAARHVTTLTGKELCGVVSLERSEDGWLVGVEVVEDRRIPSSSDMLGLYLAQVDADGELLSYRRSRRYARGRGDSSEVV